LLFADSGDFKRVTMKARRVHIASPVPEDQALAPSSDEYFRLVPIAVTSAVNRATLHAMLGSTPIDPHSLNEIGRRFGASLKVVLIFFEAVRSS
jgi:hypothetical protein